MSYMTREEKGKRIAAGIARSKKEKRPAIAKAERAVVEAAMARFVAQDGMRGGPEFWRRLDAEDVACAALVKLTKKG